MTDPPNKPSFRPPFVRGIAKPQRQTRAVDPLFAIAFQAACPLVPIESALMAVRSFDGFTPDSGAVDSVSQTWAERLCGWEAVWRDLPTEAKLVAFAFAWVAAFEDERRG